MITGAHFLIYTKSAAADKKFFRDVLKLPYVDLGGSWLIFGLPPSEIAFHPHSENDLHEFYLMTDDIDAFVEEMKKHNIKCGKLHKQSWGIHMQITLPGGGKLGVYQPRHASPKPMKVKSSKVKKPAAKKVKKKVKK